jgi:hypothetical protein
MISGGFVWCGVMVPKMQPLRLSANALAPALRVPATRIGAVIRKDKPGRAPLLRARAEGRARASGLCACGLTQERRMRWDEWQRLVV